MLNNVQHNPPQIVTDPNILTGKPVIQGTRLSVEWIMELLASGWSEAEILRNYPGIRIEDIQYCLYYATHASRL